MDLYLLDRNVVSAIRNRPIYLIGDRFQPGQKLPQPDPGLTIARTLDRKENFVSPLLSIMEGNNRGTLEMNAIMELARIESAVISNFFKKAVTDSDYLTENIFELACAVRDHTLREIDNYRMVAPALRRLLANENGEDRCRQLRDEVLMLAANHGVGETMPIVLCSIAAVYGSKHARGVLKPTINPTEGDDYNVIMDIQNIKFCLNMSNPRDPSYPTLRLATADRALNLFSRSLTALDVKTKKLASGEALVSTRVNIHAFINQLPLLRGKKKQKQELISILTAGEEDRSRQFAQRLR